MKRIFVALLSLQLLPGVVPGSAYGQNAPAVTVAEAKMQDLRETADFTGRVTSIQSVEIRARVSGFVEQIGFEEGRLVSAGDLLYQIEDELYSAAVRQIDGQIAAAEAQLRLADIEVFRKTELVEKQTVAQVELDVASANYDQIVGQIAGLRANRDQASVELSYTRIAAPFDGVTGLSAPDIGALVGPASGPLTTLTRLDPISVEFPVATAVYLDYRKQAEQAQDGTVNVLLRLPNGDAYDQTGHIDFVSSTVNAGTDTVVVRANFANPDRVLLDDALVSVELESAEPEMVLGVPRQAIQRDQQGFFVMLVDDENKVERRRVTMERSAKGQAVISDGLEEGDRVIVEGVNKVRPGIEVDAASASEG